MTKKHFLSRRSISGYGIVLSFAMFTALLIALHLGKILNLAYPIFATIVGFSILRTRRDVYVAFVWWIFMFTPEVRRFVDYQTAYHNLSPVMLTPYLVCATSGVEILKQSKFLRHRAMWPILMVSIVAIYAFIVGLFTNGISALFDLADFTTPILIGILLVSPKTNNLDSLRAFVFSTQLGLIVIAGYGLFQYFYFPPWDAYWLQAAQFTSAGKGYSEEVRLWGTLNSPGPYGIALMVSLVVTIVAKGYFRIAGGVLGFPAFGLSLVRSAWGAWFVAAIFIAARIGGKTRLRLIVFASVTVAIMLPIVMIGPVSDALSERFSTLSNIQQDGSFQAREALYESATVSAFTNPIGVGFGRFGNSTKLTTGNATDFDSGLLQIPYEFGWVAGGILVISIIAIVIRVVRIAFKTHDPIVIAAAALVLANISQEIFGFTLSGLGGLSFWLPAGLVLGSQLMNVHNRTSKNCSTASVLNDRVSTV